MFVPLPVDDVSQMPPPEGDVPLQEDAGDYEDVPESFLEVPMICP